MTWEERKGRYVRENSGGSDSERHVKRHYQTLPAQERIFTKGCFLVNLTADLSCLHFGRDFIKILYFQYVCFMHEW